MQEKRRKTDEKRQEKHEMTVDGFPIFESPEQAQEYLKKTALELVKKHQFDRDKGHLCKCGKAFDDGTVALKNFTRLWLYL